MLTNNEGLGTAGQERNTFRESFPSSYIPNNYSLPIWQIPRLPVIADQVQTSDRIAIFPEVQVIASEIEVHGGCIHFGRETSKLLFKKILCVKKGGNQHHQTEEIISNWKITKFHKPALDPVIIEQDLPRDLEPSPPAPTLAQDILSSLRRWKTIRKRRKSITQEKFHNGVKYKYVHAEEESYPRRAHDSKGSGRLILIPMFQFPERIVNSKEVSMVQRKMVLSEKLSKIMLEHCVLLIDHNDYLLKDYTNFTMIPIPEQSFGGTSFDLVMNHLLWGKWIWVTKYEGDCRRSIMLKRSTNLHEARLMYLFCTDVMQFPIRIGPIKRFTDSSGRAWDTWERSEFATKYYVHSMEKGLWIAIHDSNYREGDAGPLSWINFKDNNNLAMITRCENHHLHCFLAACSLGKRPDPFTPLGLSDSGHAQEDGQEDTSQFEIGVAIKHTLEPVTLKFPPNAPIRRGPFTRHLSTCGNFGPPGYECACPGPSGIISQLKDLSKYPIDKPASRAGSTWATIFPGARHFSRKNRSCAGGRRPKS